MAECIEIKNINTKNGQHQGYRKQHRNQVKRKKGGILIETGCKFPKNKNQIYAEEECNMIMEWDF